MKFPIAVAIAAAAHAVAFGGVALVDGVWRAARAPAPVVAAPSMVAIDVEALGGGDPATDPAAGGARSPAPAAPHGARAASEARPAAHDVVPSAAPESDAPARAAATAPATPTATAESAQRSDVDATGGVSGAPPRAGDGNSVGGATRVGDNGVGGNGVGGNGVGAATANVGGANGNVGGGNGAGGGRGGGDRASLLSDALARIRAQRRYPELARRREIEGRVRVAFHVGGDGRVDRAVVRAGADPLLDDAALDAVRRAAPLPPIGDAEVELDFRLTDE